jgi:HlyD family secretion protein
MALRQVSHQGDFEETFTFMKTRNIVIIIVAVVVIAIVVAGVFFVRASQQATQPALETGTVTQITAVSSVESSGQVAAQQAGSVYWTTTGVVGAVYVEVGDQVTKAQPLMEIDPLSAAQNVILAQADLISAQKALDEIMNPTDTAVATARQAVADAEEKLKDAKQDLTYVENPVGQPLYDAINDAKLALETAQANAQLQHVSADSTAIKNAEDDMNLAFTRLQRAQVEWDDCVKISCGERDQRERELNNAQKDYERAQNDYNAAKLKYDTGSANQADDVQNAQEDYDQAVRNLNAALLGPDALKLQTAQADVEVAESNLADAKRNLDELLNGADPDDIASAQARVLASAATVAAMKVYAPFNGEVVAVNYQVGDTIQTTLAAVQLANRTQLHVDVSVDESDVSTISVGNRVSITFDSLADLDLDGEVVQINPLGTTVQGLVRYTVRVDVTETDPRILIGMTANVNIITDTNEGALAVPLDAVQLDQQGEFVNRVRLDGTLERVNITSGEVQDAIVVVRGPLTPGDTVQLVKPVPASGFPFGG